MTLILEGVVSNLVAKVLETMGKAAFEEVASWWVARDELEKLKNTTRLIQARVRDAEQRQEDESNAAIKEWLCRLKLVLYRADDLFDEVLTRDSQKQRMESRMFGKVGILLSKSGPFYFNRKLAEEVKSINQELDDIKSDMSVLNLRNLSEEHPMARLIEKRETASFLEIEDVIGRDNDQNNILEMLFDPKYDDEKVTVIPIVGFGGLGKTTLAQMVFNVKRVKEHFDLTKWAYVPEKDDLNLIKRKIYKSFTGKSCNNDTLELVQRGIIKSIETKRYLLVLDDLWYEKVDGLKDLVNLLKCGKHGSKVIVTTRLDVVATNVSNINAPYKLDTLTDEQSWDLFKMLAFKQGRQDKSPAFTLIGKEIVSMCGNVPLAVKVVGGYLCAMHTEKEWLQARDAQRSKAQLTKGNDIMEMLKLSYDYLPSTLKQCFAYCSLLPKGCRIDRDDLVYMWMAQGYIEQSNNDTGDLVFMDLLGRNFFQELEFSADGNIKNGKMHDLLHDLAQHVAGEEGKLLDGQSSTQITQQVLHVNINNEDRSEVISSLLVARRMRTLISTIPNKHLKGLISGMQHLRVLKVKTSNMKLYNAIGRLLHLRYLYIDCHYIEYLPDSITNLENLQTLNVRHCKMLRQLPRDFAKLVSIRHLLLPNEINSVWYNSADLPREFGKLTSLQVLNSFKVGEKNGINSLPALSYRGELIIEYYKWRQNAILEAQSANLKNSDQLTSLWLLFKERITPPIDEMNEMLMNLQLPQGITNLRVEGYKGDKMPSKWLDGLSKLVSVSIDRRWKCKMIPQLSQLPHLKEVKLGGLRELEYVEDEDKLSDGGGGKFNNGAHNGYFPSLQLLELSFLRKLKGWRRVSQDD